ADHLTGVDISENMLAMAWEREVYDELYVGEATRFLEEEDSGAWDLICATDVMPYIGDLAPIVSAASSALAGGGYMAFSTETLGESSFFDREWTVGPHQRF